VNTVSGVEFARQEAWAEAAAADLDIEVRSGGVEFSDRRAANVYPAEWGTPPAGPLSEIRALWVQLNVSRQGASAERALRKVQDLEAEFQARELRLQIAALERRRSGH
jgi:hypothetical protein